MLSGISCFLQSHVEISQIVGDVSYPGGKWPPRGSPPVLWRLLKENSISISHLVPPSQMPKQGETTGFDNGGEWRLLSHSTDDIVKLALSK